MTEFGITPHQIFKNDTNKRLNYYEIKSKKDMFVNMTEILRKKEEKNLEIINEIQINEEDKKNKFITYKILMNKKGEDDNKKKLYILDNLNRIIKQFKIEQISKNINNNNNNLTEKKILKLTDNKKELKLFIPKNRLNELEEYTPIIIYNKGHCLALGGFWNGSILIENILYENNEKKEKVEKIETKIYYTKDKAPITHIIIDENEIFMLCGNNIGTVYVYIIDNKEKNVLHLYKILYDNNSPMSSLYYEEKLNVLLTCFNDGICNIYATPKYKLVNSFSLNNLVKDDRSLSSNISLISSSPLPCIIFYFKKRNSLCVCSINGHFIKEKEINYEITNHNDIKKYTDNQFIDYLLILDKNNRFIYIYNIIDLQEIMKGHLKDNYPIDFILSKDFDNLFVLVKSQKEKDNKDENNRYKILIMKNTKILKLTQEGEKKASAHIIEEETKKE